jgi:hypothetical protein
MKLLYKPFGIAAGIIGARIGKETFDAVWQRLSDSDSPPSPTEGRQSFVALAGGAALEAAVLAATAAVVDQLAARAFYQLFGAWPSKPAEAEAEGETGPDTAVLAGGPGAPPAPPAPAA